MEPQPITRAGVLALIAKRLHTARKRRDSALATVQLAKNHAYDVTREAIKAATENTVARELETLLDIVDKEFCE